MKGKPGIATDNQGFISNAGVVITDEGIVVVDALGTPSLAHKLLGEIRKISDKPIVKVIVAHYHADHILGLQVYKDLGAEVVAPTGSEKYLNSDVSTNRLEERRVSLFPWVDEDTRLVFPDRYIDKGESFQLGGVTIQLTMVGDAHSDADLMVYVENDRVLYSGDVIFEGRIPYVGSANTKHWLKVLQEMERKELAALVPGHGR
ncbi:MBL fold metallo-hydrolase [Candidatus Reidiella endopervernicosa]|uniref:MBL fold metallo-hydrolase n=1 Tax=Candidatus Reidiella endopervernicosa TaxID=2738883 RepID=A0A6N0HYA5_9GAMM|nr:MBL fold metallo-hydrolase [Candidatus Reidiella endopervernicosa]QKQ27196.1 MBL fold metallo-hydrolase [Candidatus Reidiella endopervernicosa]